MSNIAHMSVTRERFSGFVFPTIYLTFTAFWSLKNRFLIHRFCSTRTTFSCFGGKHRRNLQTFAETTAQTYYWALFIVMENILCLVLELHSDKFGERNVFIVYNLFFYIFGDFIIGILLPLNYIYLSQTHYQEIWTAPHERKTSQPERTELEKIPRRDFLPEKYANMKNMPEKCTLFPTIHARQKSLNKYKYFLQFTHSEAKFCEVDIR